MKLFLQEQFHKLSGLKYWQKASFKVWNPQLAKISNETKPKNKPVSDLDSK